MVSWANEIISYFRVDPHRVTLGDTLLVRRLKRFSIPDEPNSCRPYHRAIGCRGVAGEPGPIEIRSSGRKWRTEPQWWFGEFLGFTTNKMTKKAQRTTRSAHPYAASTLSTQFGLQHLKKIRKKTPKNCKRSSDTAVLLAIRRPSSQRYVEKSQYRRYELWTAE